MTRTWKVSAFSLATTLAVTFVLCTIFDLLFPPFGLIAAFSHASPWPITGSAIGVLTGFVMFTGAGFGLGALYGAASDFWSGTFR